MPNPWVEHVKNWAKEHNEPYGCSLSDPACKIDYITKGQKQKYPSKLFKNVSYKEDDIITPVYTKTGKISKSQTSITSGKTYNYNNLKELIKKPKK